MPRYLHNASPGIYGGGYYRYLPQVCSATPGVVTVNKKFFPSPVDDPWVAARTHSSRWIHHTVTHPDHAKTHHTTTEGNIHPTTHGTADHPHHKEYSDRSEPHPYNFVAHSKTAGGCKSC